MELVTDASVFLAIVLNEREREWVIGKTAGATIVSPEVLPYEIGNAVIAMKRKGRLADAEVLRVLDLYQRIAVRLVSINTYDAVKIALHYNIYAYDAYYLQSCIENKLPLLSLDNRMCQVAQKLNLKVVK